MFTVARLLPLDAETQFIAERLGIINSRLAVSQFEPRVRKDGFSAIVSSRPDWLSHVAEIEVFLSLINGELRRLADGGADVCVDIAVEPDDLSSAATTLRIPESVISLLQLSRASVQVSVYAEFWRDEAASLV